MDSIDSHFVFIFCLSFIFRGCLVCDSVMVRWLLLFEPTVEKTMRIEKAFESL